VATDSGPWWRLSISLVTEGGGQGWMMNPVPNFHEINCDYNATKVEPSGHCAYKCARCGPPTYAADEACPTVCSKQFPGTPTYAGADPKIFPWPPPGHRMLECSEYGSCDFAIEDVIKVPDNIPPGEYVLGWRWDCEMTSQVWTNCADITIVDGDDMFV